MICMELNYHLKNYDSFSKKSCRHSPSSADGDCSLRRSLSNQLYQLEFHFDQKSLKSHLMFSLISPLYSYSHRRTFFSMLYFKAYIHNYSSRKRAQMNEDLLLMTQMPAIPESSLNNKQYSLIFTISICNFLYIIIQLLIHDELRDRLKSCIAIEICNTLKCIQVLICTKMFFQS